ncbi:hypothetical protein FRC98_16760 [Lujinxingia vulgaris]|uniref:Uncharacterized protein n=1 Tax=Lujinxingia vulgaris TaxID=2600176 RepID=A0A5C6XEB2_9DELT|nr:hypothetical protein [Lujinxingia vulgaris]TXD35464.1 hypothetical protein FRC98_16760 [Lujinxingia vulgaris]
MDEKEKAAVVAICQKQGVSAVDAWARGAVLVVKPEVGAALPSAEVLRELAVVLADRGHRYVTLDLAGWAVEGEG